MDRFRYFTFNQRATVVLGLLQIGFAGLCVVCGTIDFIFRRETTLRRIRAPLWAGVVMAVPGTLALVSSQRKNPILVYSMIVASVLSCFTTSVAVIYACVTLSYGEEDDVLFHPHHLSIPNAKFVLSRTVKGANATVLLACLCSLLTMGMMVFLGCRSLPFCRCYDGTTGLALLIPQNDPSPQTELVCTWQGEHGSAVVGKRSGFETDFLPQSKAMSMILGNGALGCSHFEDLPYLQHSPKSGDDRLFNAPVQIDDDSAEQQDSTCKALPYTRLE